MVTLQLKLEYDIHYINVTSYTYFKLPLKLENDIHYTNVTSYTHFKLYFTLVHMSYYNVHEQNVK
jgi:hypothetical protein